MALGIQIKIFVGANYSARRSAFSETVMCYQHFEVASLSISVENQRISKNECSF